MVKWSEQWQRSRCCCQCSPILVMYSRLGVRVAALYRSSCCSSVSPAILNRQLLPTPGLTASSPSRNFHQTGKSFSVHSLSTLNSLVIQQNTWYSNHDSLDSWSSTHLVTAKNTSLLLHLNSNFWWRLYEVKRSFIEYFRRYRTFRVHWHYRLYNRYNFIDSI